MNLAEQVYQVVKPLPEAMTQEVLDFALFLRQREEAQKVRHLAPAQVESLSDWDNAEFTQMAMAQAMRGLEDEPELYSLDDAKTISPITKSQNGLLENANPDDEQKNTQQFLERIKNIKRVTAPYPSEDMVAMLREGKEHLLVAAVAHHAQK